MVKGLVLLSWPKSASEPNSLASISGSTVVSRSRKSVTEDIENLGSDSSRRLEEGDRVYNECVFCFVVVFVFCFLNFNSIGSEPKNP